MKHEVKTEKFYEVGVENYGDFHRNHLSFGLWENGIDDYVIAAERLLTRVADKIELSGDSKLLDVACGMGSQDFFLMNTYKCQKICAVDLTSKHLEVAKQRYACKNVDFIKGDACRLDLADNTFTHVMGIEGPANFNTREDFFKEAFRVLQPGGKMGLADYCLPSDSVSWPSKKLVELVAYAWMVPAANVYSANTYKQKLEAAGFTDVNIEVVSNSVIPQYVNEQFKPIVKNRMNKIRGKFYGPLSRLLDMGVLWLYKFGLLDYVLVTATKPNAKS